MRRSKQAGFSIVELMVVCIIVMILAGILIPKLQQAMIAGEQSAAVANLHEINSAESTFWQLYRDGYTLSINQLGGPLGTTPTCVNAMLINDLISNSPNQQSGYVYTFTPGTVPAYNQGIPEQCGQTGFTTYSVAATPVTSGAGYSFCIDDTAVIRVSSQGAITGYCGASQQPPLQ